MNAIDFATEHIKETEIKHDHISESSHYCICLGLNGTVDVPRVVGNRVHNTETDSFTKWQKLRPRIKKIVLAYHNAQPRLDDDDLNTAENTADDAGDLARAFC